MQVPERLSLIHGPEIYSYTYQLSVEARQPVSHCLLRYAGRSHKVMYALCGIVLSQEVQPEHTCKRFSIQFILHHIISHRSDHLLLTLSSPKSLTSFTMCTKQTKQTVPTPPVPRSTRVLRSHNVLQPTLSKVTKPKPKARRRRLDPWTSKRKANPNPKPRPPPRTHFICRICIEEQTTDQFPTWIGKRLRQRAWPMEVPLNCIEHLGRNPNRRKINPVCRTCIGRTMSARLDLVGAARVGVGCLEPGCEVSWSWDFIMKYLPGGAPLEKFNMEMMDVWRRDSDTNLVTCITPNCNAIGLPDPEAPGYPQVSCHSCALRYCVRCLVPWHADRTCTEHGAKKVEELMTDVEKETLKLMQTKDGKRCPHCYIVIEKEGGCNSMFCSGCQKYFNWATAGKILSFECL